MHHFLVSLTPSQNVVIPGTTVPFICEFVNSGGGLWQFHWLVNGTRLENLSLGDRIVDYMSSVTKIGLIAIDATCS